MDLNQLSHENALIESSYFLPQHKKRANSNEQNNKENSLKKDLKNIIFLIYLYLLQGVPLGIAASIPFILGSRKVSYADQGTYSFVFYPFSAKLLWAPIVDSLYIKKIGRRKTWLLPVQLLIGIFMFVFADYSQKLAYNIETKTDIILLTSIFTMFTVLVATQDIALDGWAISMLSKENVAWQSTCNGVGQTAGFFIGNLSFIVFESASFCNKYIRPAFNLPSQEYGMVSLKTFMYIFGGVFLVTSILVVFKKENENSDEKNLNIFESYKVIYKLLSKKSIQIYALVLLTVKLGLAAESAQQLKLIEQGVSKEKLSLLALPLAPFNIFLPVFISKFIQKRPLISFMKALPFRLISGVLFAIFIYYTPIFKDEYSEYNYKYYLLCLLFFIAMSMIETTMFISQMAFFARVSDASIGGTYMTLLATLANLGGTYPGTLALYLINSFSKRICSKSNLVNTFSSTRNFNESSYYELNHNYLNESVVYTTRSINETLYLIRENKCSSGADVKECKMLGGKCETQVDAYYYLTIVFTFIGFIWLIFFRKLLIKLSSLPKSKWEINK